MTQQLLRCLKRDKTSRLEKDDVKKFYIIRNVKLKAGNEN
jgi:hypothetical protein